MGKKLRVLLIAACAALFATSAMAEEATTPAATSNSAATADASQAEKTAQKRESKNGKYEFKRSWGIGLQYGLSFTDLTNWNDYLLTPNGHSKIDGYGFVAEHELYVEVTPVEGFRLSAFGGWQSPYIFENTGFHYFYGGIEPAWSIRRSFYEFAVGLGIGYGQYMLKAASDATGHGLLLRPFIEGRLYPCDIFAIYLRVGFMFTKSFGFDKDTDAAWNAGYNENEFETKVGNKLFHAAPHVALGFRFGSYPTPVVVIPDTDGDGVLDDIDDCPNSVGLEEHNGCPNPDADSDGVCDPWVAEQGLSEQFANLCKGSDKCADSIEDVDGFEDEDGCADPDNDSDGFCDPWVSEKGQADQYANVCKKIDRCPNEIEDIDGFNDEDGCPDPDNDRDGICDPWVAEQGLSEKYVKVCSGSDICVNVAGTGASTGCPNPDLDDDGYCESWVYEYKLERNFPHCKGIDQCPNEKGEDTKGCVYRRVQVTADKIEISEAINFALNKATIQSSSDELLADIAKVFNENPQIRKVEIQGHTDLSGKAKKNQKLSEDRAKAVYDRLIKLGVDKDRMTYKGYGMSEPVEPLAPGQKKETKEQAAKNRRVVFLITEQDEVKKTVLQPK